MLKIWISGALFEQKKFSFNNQTHVVLERELFYKNLLKRSVLKSEFRNPQNLDKKNRFFYDSRKKTFKFLTEEK